MDAVFREDAFLGREVVVVGGTSGIGAAIAERFASLGARVVAAGLGAAEAGDAHRGGVVSFVELDVTAPEDIERLFSCLDRLDVLVSCAGVILRQKEYQADAFARVLEVNLLGTMRCCNAAAGLLAEASGSIVNVASMTSFFGAPHAPAYGASKAAIVQLTKSLAIAYAPRVRVNAIAPGWIRTDLTMPLQEDIEASRRILDRTPAGRWGERVDVAGAAIFLSSAAAGFVTGATVPVDGGYSAS